MAFNWLEDSLSSLKGNISGEVAAKWQDEKIHFKVKSVYTMAYKQTYINYTNDKGVYFHAHTGNRRLFLLKDTMMCSKTS